MNQFENVKTLVLISFLVTGAYGVDKLSFPYPKLECGIYQATGYLDKNPNAGYVLRMRKASTSPVEILLWGGEPKEMFVRKGTRVSVEVYVPQPIKDAKKPVTYFHKFLKGANSSEDSVSLLEKKACGQVG